MSQRTHNRKDIARVILIIAALLAVIGAALAAVRLWEKRQMDAEAAAADPETRQEDRPLVRYDGAWYAQRDDLETYLIMGLDKYEDTVSDSAYFLNNQQADFLFLVIVDQQAGTYEMLHINRDTMAEIQRLGMGGLVVDTFTGQLALAHTYGSGGKDSCRNEAQAVSTFLYDIPIDHYISITMDAVAMINDMVGGVTVRVEDDFSELEPSFVMGEDVTLLGEKALIYVRMRKGVGDQTNISRMARQRQYISALGEKVQSAVLADDTFALRLLLQISNYMVSDCTANQLSDLANILAEYSVPEIRTIDGESVVGETFMEFYPDEDALQAQIIDIFFEKVDID